MSHTHRDARTAPRRAALDIGSNTIMLLVAHDEDGVLAEDREWYRTTRLGEGLDRNARLRPEAVERTIRAAAHILSEARDAFPALSGTGVATSAVRDARNGAECLDRCEKTLGFRPRALSGEEEARYVFRGVASDRAPSETLLHIDIGGGSSEITAGTRGNCLFAESVPVGCVRLAERFDLYGISSDASRAAATAAVRDRIAPVLERLRRRTPEDEETPTVLATGGTATTFAAMCLAMNTYDRKKIHGFRAAAGELRDALPALACIEPRERADRPGIAPDRAAVLPAGLIILSTFLDLLGVTSFDVSTRALRAGLIDAMIRGELAPAW